MKRCEYCDTIVESSVYTCPACGQNEFVNICPNCGKEVKGQFCPGCGTRMDAKKKICPICQTVYFSHACPSCGYVAGSDAHSQKKSNVHDTYGEYHEPSGGYSYGSQQYAAPRDSNVSPKGKLLTLLLCVVLGVVGGHHFYTGRIGMGLLYLFTGGLCYVGVVIDIYKILTNKFTDKNGLVVSEWDF